MEVFQMLAKEIKIDFSRGFPVNVSLFRSGRQIPHYHKNTFEMILCLKGDATVYSMHEKHLLKPGDIIETDMYDVHSISASDGNTGENLMASFHFDLTHPVFSAGGYNLLYYICSSSEASPKQRYQLNRVKMILLTILSYYMENSESKQIIRLSQKLLSIIREHFQYYDHINVDENMYPPEMKDRFERIMAFMLENYDQKITMQAICDREHISYNYLSRFFKDSSLKTFRNFLHEIRVYHSEHLLLCNPDVSVPDISYQVGFSDPKIFYREFRRKHGHTPHRHRIWYRNYNGELTPDIPVTFDENADEIRLYMTRLFAEIVSDVITPK
jgi:xylan 1,4-beta-xylosidase